MVELQIVITADRGSANGDSQIDQAIWVGEEDVTKAARAPELFGNSCQFPVTSLGDKFSDVAGKEES